MASFIIIVFLAFSLVVVALAGFVWIQIKCKPVWSSSIALLLFIACWASGCFFYKFAELTIYSKIGENYTRRLNFFVAGLDNLALQGRTNEIHQACEKFGGSFALSPDQNAVSNFNSLALDTYDLSTEPAMAATTNKP